MYTVELNTVSLVEEKTQIFVSSKIYMFTVRREGKTLSHLGGSDGISGKLVVGTSSSVSPPLLNTSITKSRILNRG